MIKVLQILPGLNRGGMETFVMNMYRAMDKTVIQFDFLVNQDDGDYKDEIISLGGIIHVIPARHNGISAYHQNLDNFFKSHSNYSAVHYHESSLTSLEPLFYAKKYKIKNRIIHSHSSAISGNKLHYLTHYFGKFFLKKLATHYFGCSDKAIEWMYSYTGILSKAKIINNGINVTNFSFNIEKRNQIRESLGLKDHVVIGHVGRFIDIKNQSFLVTIFEEFHKLVPSSTLIFIGEGETIYNIKQLVARRKLERNVLFLGSRANVNELMQGLDIFVMPSLFEGLPLTLVEAQATGLLVFASDTISFDSKLTDNIHYYSLNESPKQWAQKINNIHSTFTRIDSSQLIVSKGFDIKTICSELINTYKNG